MPDPTLDDVAVFVRVVDAGGFSAAARSLHSPKSSVSRRVSRLEGALGVRLLHRSTRSLALTEAGRAYYDRVAAALDEMTEAASAAAAEREVPRGLVRMSAPLGVGAEVLPTILQRFVARYPEVRVQVDLTADPPSLVSGGYDLALRAGRPRDASLAVVRLQDSRFGLYAAPAYLAEVGVPGRVEDVPQWRCLPFQGVGGPEPWRLRGPGGEVVLRVSGPVAANDLSLLRRAAVAGAGIALLPELVGEPLCRAGRLSRVLPEHHARDSPLYLAHPAARHVPLRVRALRDALVEHFPA